MSIESFMNKHEGRIAFVLGTGPSLRFLDPSILKDHISIAVNGAILKAPEADYYFSCDYGMVLWKNWLELKQLQCDLILACNVGFTAFEPKLDTKVFEGINESRVHYAKRKDGLQIDKNLEILSGSSSVHSAVHFAHIIGCSTIILLGCDCKYDKGKKHYWDFPDQPKDCVIKPEYEALRMPLSPTRLGARTDGELQSHLRRWRELRKQNPSINIIDCSGGALNMFPQMSIQEALK